MNENESSPESQNTSEEFKRRRAEQLFKETSDAELIEEYNLRKDEIDRARKNGIIPREFIENIRTERALEEFMREQFPVQEMKPLDKARLKKKFLAEVKKMFSQNSPTEDDPNSKS